MFFYISKRSHKHNVKYLHNEAANILLNPELKHTCSKVEHLNSVSVSVKPEVRFHTDQNDDVFLTLCKYFSCWNLTKLLLTTKARCNSHVVLGTVKIVVLGDADSRPFKSAYRYEDVLEPAHAGSSYYLNNTPFKLRTSCCSFFCNVANILLKALWFFLCE